MAASPSWCEVSLVAERALAERLTDLLPEHGASAVTMTDAGDEPVMEPDPGTSPLWSAVRVTALFPADAAFATLRAGIEASLAPEVCPRWTVYALEERDWVREALARFTPMRFGDRLWVCPSWCEPPAGSDVIVTLDPGVAFGTGTHPSTALCLDWLAGEPLAGARVVDYGCGSGILGIAALALGAAAVDAVDIDVQARDATLDNAGRNALAGRIAVHAPPVTLGRADYVVANILCGPLVELSATLLALLGAGGRLALAGLTAAQIDEVAAAYCHAIDWDPPATRDGWARLSGTAR